MGTQVSGIRGFLFALVLSLFFVLPAAAQITCNNQVCTCQGGSLPQGDMRTFDLVVSGACTADGMGGTLAMPALYVFHNINVVSGGSLTFLDKPIDFHLESMVIENNASVSAGSTMTPIGSNGGRLRIYLWGGKGEPGVTCKTNAHCGIPDQGAQDLWDSNTTLATHTLPHPKNGPCNPASRYGIMLPDDDCFYQYDVVDNQDRQSGNNAYFGHKVIALSFGGTLHLYGNKGAIYDNATDANAANTGISWARLKSISSNGGQQMLTLDLRPGQTLNWQHGDQIVVTTTDYLPTHSEVAMVDMASGNTVTLTGNLQFPHNTSLYSLANLDSNFGPRPDSNLTIGRGVETRAAVALLTRSILITSEGNQPDTDPRPHDHFPPTPGNYFGGHTIVRQGFASYQAQGVEFWRLGQGQIIGHYPIHFHMARKTPQPSDPNQPPVTFVKDCSIHESMTRWITVHATQGVTLQRNVGYQSIGHGYYLEDATEINNKLYANIGISVIGAVYSDTLNPREVPGILARPGDPPSGDFMPYRSDWNHPTTFWMMNGWNDFRYNAAVGVTTCGACYWLLPAAVSGPSVYEVWNGYASQGVDALNNTTNNLGRAGLSPLETFIGNSCTAAQSSFQTVGDTYDCLGVAAGAPTNDTLGAVPNPIAPQQGQPGSDIYYPQLTGLRLASQCQGANDPHSTVDCSNANPNPSLTSPCAPTGPNKGQCVATVLDHYTSSFTYAQTNFAGIWLRPWWYLVTDSAITDAQYGGLNFVTGGGYTRADAPGGFWSLAYHDVFIGTSQAADDQGDPANPYAGNAGPFNPTTQLSCDNSQHNYCLSKDALISMQLDPFGGQRMLSVYDGPAFQQNNAFLDVYPTTLKGCTPSGPSGGECPGSGWAYGRIDGVPKDSANTCYLPNAAIAWKQPNGFYYPPAFHSQNLFFQNTNIRHFLIEPVFLPGTYKTDVTKTAKRYCNFTSTLFDNYTDIDRQTVLDDGVPGASGGDGSLTGLTGSEKVPTKAPMRETISVNEDSFFDAPLETVECASDKHPTDDDGKGPPGTAKTSPYEYLTTAIIADCAVGGFPHECVMNGLVYWSHDCGGPFCFGPQLYRQYLTQMEEDQNPKPTPFIRMMGQGNGQRSSLSLNHGRYYIDTTPNCAAQGGCVNQGHLPPHSVSVFLAGHTYHTYFVYGRSDTQQTYDIYIGKNASSDWKVTPERAILNDNNFKFIPDDGAPWLSTPTYNSDTGILSVTLDLTKSPITSEFQQEFSGFCQPTTYCAVNGTTCGCKPGTNCKDNDVCSWGPKDPDCTENGCFGFAFTMPTSWVLPDNPLPPPQAQPFTADPYFNASNVLFQQVDVGKSGQQCYYNPPPSR